MRSYEVQDNISPFLKKLFDVSEGLGLQAMNKAGSKIRNKMSARSKRVGSHKYGQRIVNGRRTLLDTRHGSGKPYYSRVSHTTNRRETDMGDLVRFKMYEHSRTLLVGWINTKSYHTTFYKGGIPSKGNFVKGTKTKHIAEVMAKGGRQELSEAQKKLFRRSGWGKAASRGFVNRKAHPFMNFTHYLGTANEVARKEFNEAIKQFQKTA